MKIRTLIIDDEKQARNSLLSDLKKHLDQLEIIGEAESVETAIAAIDKLKPELIFLDINLGDGYGFNVIERCKHTNYKTIFVTAYDQYAIKAFKVSALDFLLKPVDQEELDAAIERAVNLQQAEKMDAQMKVFKDYGNSAETEKKIVLKELEAIHVVKVKDLIACEASGIYTTFYTGNGKQIIVSKNLKEYEEILEPFGFLRIHNSFLINGNKIEKFERTDGGIVEMEGGRRIPVSQRKRDVVISFLKSI
jgi:two-component system, LytTR family, response regulator